MQPLDFERQPKTAIKFEEVWILQRCALLGPNGLGRRNTYALTKDRGWHRPDFGFDSLEPVHDQGRVGVPD